MQTLTATDARGNLFNLFSDISEKHKTYKIKYKKKGVVMINEEDYDELIETIELLSESGFSDKLKKAEKEIKSGDTFTFDEVFNNV